jgi:hypothetical protein
LETVVVVPFLNLNGNVFFNGALILSNGTVSFDQATIYVGASQIAVNASCVNAVNSTIVVDSSQAG